MSLKLLSAVYFCAGACRSTHQSKHKAAYSIKLLSGNPRFLGSWGVVRFTNMLNAKYQFDELLASVVACSVVCVLAWSCKQWYAVKAKAKTLYPPGPTPVPILGNIFSVDSDKPWVSYTRWAKAYGDIVYSRMLFQDVIILSSLESARRLLEKRSTNYSDRPLLSTVPLFQLDWTTVLLPYNDRWRIHRRLFHQTFREAVIRSFHPMQLQKAFELVQSLLVSPERYISHLQMHSSSHIMSAVYDYDAKPDDPLIAVVETASEYAARAVKPVRTAVLGAFPFLAHIPAWFPGASFKSDAILLRKYMPHWVEDPFNYTKDSIAANTAKPCMVSHSLEVLGSDATGGHERVIKECAASSFAAGSETTSATLRVFILAMVQNPRVQERAQAEIDRVIGRDRLPTFEDRPRLPYVEAVLREVLRWSPVVPVIIHATSNDDVYNGYHIPKGATVFGNIWAMAQDDTVYPNPTNFNPDRFILPGGGLNDDTVSFIFGFGRRICPGRHFADASMWSAIACMLAVFKISPPQDEHGNEVGVDAKFWSGLTFHPLPFACRIVPRDAKMNADRLTQLVDSSTRPRVV